MNQAARPSICPDPAPARSCVPAIPDGIEAMVFDFDGTLADTTPSHEQALRAALQPHGLDLDHDWYRGHVGLSIHDLLATVHSIAPIACAVSLLRAARRAGLPCAVASGASRLLVHPGIDALGLRHAFAAVVAREDVTSAPRGRHARDHDGRRPPGPRRRKR
jgi:beta-phosphoglucomutase-like phosphatase (HAD superfamily)